MSIIADLTAILQPLAADLASEFGTARVTVYRVVKTESATGGIVHTYPNADPLLTNLAAFLLPNNSEAQTTVGAPQAVRPTGTTDDQSMRLLLPIHNGALPVLNAFDGIKVLSGAYAGYTFVCVTDSAPDAVGIMAGATVLSAPAGAIS